MVALFDSVEVQLCQISSQTTIRILIHFIFCVIFLSTTLYIILTNLFLLCYKHKFYVKAKLALKKSKKKCQIYYTCIYEIFCA